MLKRSDVMALAEYCSSNDEARDYEEYKRENGEDDSHIYVIAMRVRDELLHSFPLDGNSENI